MGAKKKKSNFSSQIKFSRKNLKLIIIFGEKKKKQIIREKLKYIAILKYLSYINFFFKKNK